ncbi:hypothetical protein ACFB49_30630 [Sphingomonas sp. DBB INV C78]|uniref:DUF1622 domain-containing protein n=1 Tax=Sphingomonas sp. DBB INV C78 TaxID=3349434 RepID=UPI0036D3C62D
MSGTASHELVRVIHASIEWAALGIEVLAVAIIVAGVVVMAVKAGTVRYLFRLTDEGSLRTYKQQLGRPLLLGLELLVAADVIRTVALEPTLSNVAVLGLLVLIRTVLSWSLSVEIDGHWPWQGNAIAPDRRLNGHP